MTRIGASWRERRWVATLALLLGVAGAWSMPGAAGARGGGPSWSSAVAVSPTVQPDPTRGSQTNALAVNAAGLAIAAWDQVSYAGSGGATIGAAVLTGGRWGAPFTISGLTGFSSTPSVAVGADGTMAVSWTYQDPVATTPSPRQRIQVAVRPAGASSWTTHTLAEGPVGGVAVTLWVPVGVDRYGNVTAAWTLWDGVRHVVQSARLLRNANDWDRVATLSGTDDGLYIGLAVHPEGEAAVVYSLSPYTSYAIGTSVKFASRDTDGNWTSPVTVSETMPSTVGYVTWPQVALDGNRLATVIYMGNGVEAVRQLSGGAWTAPRTLVGAPAGSSYMSPDLAVDSAGNAVVALSIFDATIGVDRASVWVARGTPQGDWSPAQRLTDPAASVDAYATRAAVSPDGALAMVGWIDHYHGVVQVSRWMGTAWGAVDTIGRGTAFASFQEVLGLDVGSGTVANAIWKSTAKGGLRTMAASYR